ncbi:6-carboxytetrahydropterin synthase [Bradyrhizobium neotropicale]|uniref:6-pyruvoyl trahydropterin synthase family protein n=1 Tax=Bradyrhizobium neotropicale TaxID=1497615 RepID=UPI001AD7576A|nr:6-carboxytetrahydropterin synthase [Bradyrhizobium neotropicale]MBO4221970.1 6-pyruvoyl tetrahydrobiopterin synthase [Bradyrhizobium neotropicale]
MTFRAVKTYGYDLGLSCCFRQWRASSHCRHLHGYALSFELVLEADQLDGNGWVIDFGALKPIKNMLYERFDHAMQVAVDDPALKILSALAERDACHLAVVRHVGAEAFAAQVFAFTVQWLQDAGYGERVRLVSVTVKEHNANAATAFGPEHAIAAE